MVVRRQPGRNGVGAAVRRVDSRAAPPFRVWWLVFIVFKPTVPRLMRCG